MKLFTTIFFTASLVSLHALIAQDATTVPIPDSNPPATPAGQPTPAPLFPNENPPPIVEKQPHHGGGGGTGDRAFVPQYPPAKKMTTEESIENVADNIKYREAKTKALRDGKVQAELAAVDAAKTDQEKRAAWKRYYTVLSDKILKIDGSIKKLVATRLKESLNQLDQSKVRPQDYPQEASAAH